MSDSFEAVVSATVTSAIAVSAVAWAGRSRNGTGSRETNGVSWDGGGGKGSWLGMFPGMDCGTWLKPGSPYCEDGKTLRSLDFESKLDDEETAALKAKTAERRYAKPRTEAERLADPDDTAWLKIDDGVDKRYGQPNKMADRVMDALHSILRVRLDPNSTGVMIQRGTRVLEAGEKKGFSRRKLLELETIEDRERKVYGYHISPIENDPRRMGWWIPESSK